MSEELGNKYVRGLDPRDVRLLSPRALSTLREAARDVSWLLDRGYPRDTTLAFVGNRHQLARRQRTLLGRATCGEVVAERRRATCLPLEGAAGQEVWVDGLNALVTLEVALTGGPVIAAQDGSVRDLAGVSGAYHPIPQTRQAAALLVGALVQAGVTGFHVLIDAPVSNSGRLAALVRETAAEVSPNLPCDVRLEGNVDGALRGHACVVSSDSNVIDHALGWLALDTHLVRAVKDAWVIDLFDQGRMTLCP